MAAPPAAAAADGEGDGSEKSAFRCIDVVRFAVASVVMVLIVSVIVNAVQVLLRPESLSLSVVRGTVSLRRTKLPPVLFFDIDVRGNNPSGRARMYYLHVVGFLLDNSTSPLTSTPEPESIVFFGFKDTVVPQLEKVDILKEANAMRGKTITEVWFDRLYGSTDAAVAGVTLRLKGVLATESYGLNKTRPVTHLCGPLLVGGDPDDEAYKNLEDVLCAEATEIE